MDITKIILDYIEHNNAAPVRNYIGASTIGHPCQRYIWYNYKGKKGAKNAALTQITFDIGKQLETLILDYLIKAGLKIECPKEPFESKSIPDFKGNVDALLILDGKPIVLEIKTAKASSFNQFKAKHLQEWQPKYWAQIQAYMGFTGFNDAIIIVINKDSSEIHHEWINFNEAYYHELEIKAAAISLSENPPERINKSPLFYICQSCQYKEICFNE